MLANTRSDSNTCSVPTKVIYTTPIKAPSNQKFMELSSQFGASRVGLMTGDVSIAADAPAVVMTLEILQAMLFKQAHEQGTFHRTSCEFI